MKGNFPKLRTESQGRNLRPALCSLAASLAIFLTIADTRGKPPEFHDYSKETLVLYNSKVAESRKLALFYAKSRDIPQANLVGLACPEQTSISWEQYQKHIETPLRKAFEKNGWWKTDGDAGEIVSQNKRVFAIIYGMPLRVVDEDNSFRPETATASIDSELMQFGVKSASHQGHEQNPFFGKEDEFHEANLPGYFLVGRIDAATKETAKRMITDAIEVEKTGLWGFSYVDFGKMYPQGDQWMSNIAATNRNFGIPTIVDEEKPLFPANYPVKDPALYYGWYAQKIAGMPGKGKFKFRKGAVACHIFSFSAKNLIKPDQVWVPRLLELGAAAVLGNVSEPYLPLTTHLDKFNATLQKGRSVAEAFHAATPGLSWMNILCGDPLYRPFAAHQSIEPGTAPRTKDDSGDYQLFYSATQAWIKGDPKVLVQKLDTAGTKLRSITIFESLGLLAGAAGQKEIANTAFKKALGLARTESDRTRLRLHGLQLMMKSDPDNKTAEVTALKKILADTKDKDLKNGIQGYLNRLNPPPPPQPKQPGKSAPKKRPRQNKKKNSKK